MMPSFTSENMELMEGMQDLLNSLMERYEEVVVMLMVMGKLKDPSEQQQCQQSCIPC